MKGDRRDKLLEELVLVAEMVFESNRHDDGIVEGLDRMMRIILEVRPRRLNDKARKRLVTHLKDSVAYGDPSVELGGSGERNELSVEGTFDLGELSKRIIWTHDISGQIIDAEKME